MANKNSLKELSATGTGATAQPGSGEGMATKYAFAGGGGTIQKRKKGLLLTRGVKEEVSKDAGYLYDIDDVSSELLDLCREKIKKLAKIGKKASSLKKKKGGEEAEDLLDDIKELMKLLNGYYKKYKK
jgi:hypothetical protein